MSSAQSSWWKNATIYQIYPASFKDSNGDGIGDVPGIISQLDYIKSLGVDGIWVCPFYDSPQYDMGYDISNYEAIYPPYGTVADVEDLISACHDRGLRIIFDLVINHTSHLHAWFQESRSSKDNPKRDWYIWKPARYDEHGNRRPPNNWRSQFEGSVWEWDEETQEYYLHIFSPEQPDLNWENPVTRAAIYESAMEFWLRKGVDGFRVDTVNMYSKDPTYGDAPILDSGIEWQFAAPFYCNGPRIHEYLREMNQILRKYDAMTVGELPYTHQLADVLSYVSAQEEQLNMVFQFDVVDLGFARDLKYDTVPRNWTLKVFKEAVQRTQLLMDNTDGWSTTFLENHDRARSISRFGCTDSPELWQLSGKMLAMLITSLSGTLFVYQGQEIGMVNAPEDWPISEFKNVESVNYYNFVRELTGDNPAALARARSALGHLGRDHARLPMQWDGTSNAGFTTAESIPWMRVHDDYQAINVKRQVLDHKSLLSFWKEMLQVRKKHPEVFAHGVFVLLDSDNKSVFTFEKMATGEKLLVTLNFTKQTQPMNLKNLLGAGQAATLAKNYEDAPLDVLRPFEGRVYHMKNTQVVDV